MPHKTTPDSCEDFDIESPSVMMDNLGGLISDDYEDDDMEFDDTASMDPARVTSRGRIIKRNGSGSSWQRIEALNESRHLRALLKEYYED